MVGSESVSDAGEGGPLAGVRVVELSSVVMGPMAARILGDLGADVIKVEPPEGDFIRFLEPSRTVGMSGFFLNLNRNKRSVVIDLASPDGHARFLELIASADVFMTNVRDRALRKLHITDAELRDHNANLIYCSATGFGREGPYAGNAAYDDVIQAVSGLASSFTMQGREPAYVPSVIADKVAALHIVYAITAALYRRTNTGVGENIEVPMAEVMAAFNLVEQLNGHAFEPPLGMFGYGRIVSAGRRPRRSADGWVCVMPYTDANWRDFFDIAERSEVARDERFASINSRVDHVTALYDLLDEIVMLKPTAFWIERCAEKSIPAAPVNDIAHLEDDAHYAAVGLLSTHEHPLEGPYRVIKDPVGYASGSAGVRRHAPRLGEHTDEILDDLRRRA